MGTTEEVERKSHEWDGTLLSRDLNPDSVSERIKLASAAKAGDWAVLMRLLNERPSLVNSVRPDSRSGFTPLHQAAYNNAPEEIICQLIALGAFRTLKSSSGQQPVDIAKRRGFRGCAALLEPEMRHLVEADRLSLIQELFHGLVRAVLVGYRIRQSLRLPQLSVLAEFAADALWFPVPGMHGGFNIWLESEGNGSVVIAEHWSRVVGGSGMRHRITPFEVILLEEGFV